MACRVVQGLGGALVSPAALSILTTTFAEGPARNRALGIFGAVGGTAATVGMIAGGALTTGPGWQWVFLMNVPVGVVLIAGLVLAVPAGRRPPRTSFDVAGAVTVTGGLVARRLRHQPQRRARLARRARRSACSPPAASLLARLRRRRVRGRRRHSCRWRCSGAAR